MWRFIRDHYKPGLGQGFRIEQKTGAENWGIQELRDSGIEELKNSALFVIPGLTRNPGLSGNTLLDAGSGLSST